MADEKSYGWTGKMLRVNFSSGIITTEPTEPYKKFIGGMGIANKIIYDEVPVGTDPLSEEAKVVWAVGPLTASGTPLAGRSTASFLSTFTTDYLVVDAHTGGMFGAKLKLAGWDAVIFEGASEKPVYLHIKDDEVTIKDAEFIWGLGTRATTEMLSRKEGTDTCVASIGKAGENLLPYACVLNSRNHSAGGGLGAVFGSKKLKAIVVEGNGVVHIADPQKVADLSDYMLAEVIGSNNNHVVPSTQQEWAEYYSEGSRWTARKGLTWGAAEGGAIDVGEPKPDEPNTVGYRCQKAYKDFGPASEKYTVKMNGCHGCPIHCYSDVVVEKTGELTGYKTGGNTCVPNSYFTGFMQGILQTENIDLTGDSGFIWNTVIGTTADDLGLWCNYSQLYRDIAHCIKDGVFDRVLPEEEKALFDWGRIEADDPSIMVELMNKIAENDSEIAYIGHGPIVWTERWDDAEWFDKPASALVNYRGWPVHHSIECFGQVGGVYNMMFNRDDMIHSAVNFQGCGLPIELLKEIAGEIWGSPDAIDPPKSYTPMNEYKANFIWWSLVTDVLHDSLTLCNWVWPMAMSPTKRRDYRGDLDLEAQFYTAVTGEQVTTDDLYKAAAAILTLQRAATVRGMANTNGTLGNNNLRNDHDKITEWAFTKDPDLTPFSEGTDKMDRDDFQKALTMTYERFGWDSEKGCPTRDCLEYYGLEDVKDELDSLNLLP